MKKVKKKSNENYHFYSREKSLYIAWVCFRNDVNEKILCVPINIISSVFYGRYLFLRTFLAHSISISTKIKQH